MVANRSSVSGTSNAVVGKPGGFLVSLGGDDEDRRALRPHVLHQLQHLAVAQHGVGIRGSLVAITTNGASGLTNAFGPCFNSPAG